MREGIVSIHGMNISLGYWAPLLWMGLAGWYLLIAVPVLFAFGVCITMFAFFVPQSRCRIRGTCVFLCGLSLVHAGLAKVIFSAVESSLLWSIALIGTPLLFILSSMLSAGSGDDS